MIPVGSGHALEAVNAVRDFFEGVVLHEGVVSIVEHNSHGLDRKSVV